jgi:hypothetical protein
MEGSGRSLFNVLSQHLLGRTEENQEILGQDGSDIGTRECQALWEEEKEKEQ